MPSTTSKLNKLNFKPGFHRESTQYSEEGSWYDGDRVRFREGKPENIRGYQKHYDVAFQGIGRDLLTWANNDTQKLLSVGTEKKLYLLYNDYNYDITPITTVVSIGDIGTQGSFSTSAGSPLIEVSLNSNNVSVGDFIEFSNTSINGFGTDGLDFSTSSFGGPVFEVASKNGINNFYITVASVATSTQTNQGHGIASFLLASGQTNAIQGLGYGAGVYNAGVSSTAERAWNEPATASNIVFQATQWKLDNWGEDVLAVRRGSQLFHWDADASTTPVRSTVVNTGPTKINSIVVSPNDRHVIALGTNEFATSVFNPLLIRWSDQNNFTNWTPSISSTSGELDLADGTELIGGIRGRNTINLWTDNSMHSLQFVGPPFIFKLTQLGSACGLIAPHAAVDVDGVSYWMSDDNFYVFDGRVRKLDCTVRRYLYDDFNMTQKDKVYAGINSEFHEIIWLYPKAGSEEPNAYVIFNYMENTWVYGTGFYTTFSDNNVFLNTITTGEVSAGTGQFIWDNEPTSVFTGDDAALSSFIESADFDIEDGDDLLFVNRVIPDFTINLGSIELYVNTKIYPSGLQTTKGPFVINNGTTKIDMRSRGRQANIKISCSDLGTSWKWGSVRMALQPDGKR
jgi:hypothetical protein